MPGLARRLVRRYLPARVRRAAYVLRTGAAPKPRKPPKPAGKPSGKPPGLVESLRTGQPLADGVLAEIHRMLVAGKAPAADSLAASLRKEPDTATVGTLACAVVAFNRGYRALAWTHLSEVPAGLRWRLAADEYVRSGITFDRDATLAEIRRLLDEAPDSVGPQTWTHVLDAVFGAHEEELARRIFAVLDRQVGDGAGLEDIVVVSRDWIRRWIAASADSPDAPAVPPGHVSFAIMDYGHPGRSRASANIGDHVQSLASLGHLVRHQDLTFHGPQDLVDLLQQLHGRVRPELQLRGTAADVDVVTVDRDASMYKEIPSDTWILAFGWFMHPLFQLRFGFPFHHNLLPIFLSFHCNKRELLTEEALDYLRRNGPVGCRDWTTVDLLLSVDVPAFFSGCMTTTARTVFPQLPAGPRAGAPVGYVDIPAHRVPQGGVTYRHSSDAVRFRGFATNVDIAMQRLETYRRDHSAIVTSRLHCWLPVRSLGVPVDFQPKNRADIRFAGLIDTTDAEFERIRDGIDAKLEQVMGAILSGRPREEVYRLWRALTAADVEAARQRHEATAPVAAPPAGLADDVARAVASTVTRAATDAPAVEPLHVAVHVRAKPAAALRVLLTSLVEHASRPLHVWLVAREQDSVDLPALAGEFPQVGLSLVPTRGLGDDLRRGDGSPVVPKDVDLLLLGELLPNVDRVVLLPVDAVVGDDIAQLAGLDLQEHLLAAPTVIGSNGTSGFGVIHNAGLRLQHRTVAATELRRRAYGRHTFDFDAFGIDVLVLDLARFRQDKVPTDCLPYVEEFGLNLREVLHLAVGPHRGVVPERWHWVPTRSAVPEPALTHWADPVKPWDTGYAAGQERWWQVADRLQRQAG